MRRKPQHIARIKRGVWLRHGDWTPTYAQQQHEQQGIEIQHFACDAQGKVVYAGVTRHERINRATARQIHCVWLRWRQEYATLGNGNPRPDNPVTHLVLFPVDSPELTETFYV